MKEAMNVYYHDFGGITQSARVEVKKVSVAEFRESSEQTLQFGNASLQLSVSPTGELLTLEVFIETSEQ